MVRVAAHILLTILMTVTLVACEPTTRHRLLTFFFTGVPPLDENVVKEEIREPPPPVAVSPRRVVAPAGKLYSHPLWVAGACDPCHETRSTFGIPGVQKQSASAFKTGGGRPAQLIMPNNKLCIQCHKDKTAQRALEENLWLHNTTAKGDCMECHDPHQSTNEKTLRQPPAVICFLPCHREGKYLQTPAHQKTKDCLSCHNPHMGVDKNLLTKEYREIKKTVAHVPGHPELVK